MHDILAACSPAYLRLFITVQCQKNVQCLQIIVIYNLNRAWRRNSTSGCFCLFLLSPLF